MTALMHDFHQAQRKCNWSCNFFPSYGASQLLKLYMKRTIHVLPFCPMLRGLSHYPNSLAIYVWG